MYCKWLLSKEGVDATDILGGGCKEKDKGGCHEEGGSDDYI